MALADFVNAAAIFGRFTITGVKLVAIPISGFVLVLPSYRGPLALGYFNDGTAVAAPASMSVVMEDE